MAGNKTHIEQDRYHFSHDRITIVMSRNGLCNRFVTSSAESKQKSYTRSECARIIISPFMGLLCRTRNKTMWVPS